MAPWLSQRKGTVRLASPSSVYRRLSHISFFVPAEAAMNSDSIVDRATQVWRRLCQEMEPLLRMKTAPDVERLFSRSPA